MPSDRSWWMHRTTPTKGRKKRSTDRLDVTGLNARNCVPSRYSVQLYSGSTSTLCFSSTSTMYWTSGNLLDPTASSYYEACRIHSACPDRLIESGNRDIIIAVMLHVPTHLHTMKHVGFIQRVPVTPLNSRSILQAFRKATGIEQLGHMTIPIGVSSQDFH